MDLTHLFNDNVFGITGLTQMGFSSFVARYTTAIAVGAVLLFIIYKYVISPIINAPREDEEIDGEEDI